MAQSRTLISKPDVSQCSYCDQGFSAEGVPHATQLEKSHLSQREEHLIEQDGSRSITKRLIIEATKTRRFSQKINVFSLKTIMRRLVIGGFVVLTDRTIQTCAARSEFVRQNASLIGERDALRRENSRLVADVTRLHTELSPFRTVALQRYGSMDTAAMATLSTNLLSVQRDLASVRETVQAVDSRTDFIRILPDGRTMMGDFITGQPTVLMSLMTQAIEAYNSQKYDHAVITASDFIARYEETKKQTQQGVGLHNANWALMAGTMYGMLAEKALSDGNLDLALAHANKSTQMNPSTFNDVTKTVILITRHLCTNFRPRRPSSSSRWLTADSDRCSGLG